MSLVLILLALLGNFSHFCLSLHIIEVLMSIFHFIPANRLLEIFSCIPCMIILILWIMIDLLLILRLLNYLHILPGSLVIHHHIFIDHSASPSDLLFLCLLLMILCVLWLLYDLLLLLGIWHHLFILNLLYNSLCPPCLSLLLLLLLNRNQHLLTVCSRVISVYYWLLLY